jgi:RNA polymerase sigma-70 factor (sigma-E family)
VNDAGTRTERAIAAFEPAPGRLERLGEWFAAAYEPLLRFAYFLTGNRVAAEDLVQDTFVKLYRADRRIDEVGFMAYARRTMINLHRSAFRRVVAERRAVAATHAADAVHLDPTDHTWSSILALPRGQRAIVALRYYEGLTEQEIADTLGVSAGTVKKQMHRAMATLRAALGDRSES